MQFTIENISEDSFYVNLLLGLPKVLMKFKKYGLKGHFIRRLPQLTEAAIHAWENCNGVLLPLDLKKFYMSTNGFVFEWNLNFGNGDYDVIAGIVINALHDVVHLESVRHVEVNKHGTICKPCLGNEIRVFTLAQVGNGAQVVLIFTKFKFSNNIWLRSSDGRYSYLASDFSTYFRMCIAHLGIPHWQLIYTSQEVPQWVTCLTSLLAPHVAQKNVLANEKCPEFVNKLDPCIFKDDYVSNADKKVVRKKNEKEKIPLMQKSRKCVK